MIRIKTRTFTALAAALLASALFAAPLHAVGTDDPPPAADKKPAATTKPASDKKPAAEEKKPASDKKPAAEEKKPAADDKKAKPKEGSLPTRPNLAKAPKELAHEEFLREYRAARQLIVTGNYKAGIAAMHAIGQDEHPDVANYIGYAYRHLGDYDNSKVWYEAALKADPNHVRTWSYYGMWQMEQGNRLKALDHLQKVSAICGNTSCEEYRMLKDVIDGKASY